MEMTQTHPIIDCMAEVFSANSRRFLLGVSGGVDSMCLLDASVRALRGVLQERELSSRIAVAHIDHGLRDTSKRDAEFVKAYAIEFGLPFFATRLTKPREGENLEAWARRERYKFFSSVMDKEGYESVLTAHHAGDYVETFLMRMLSNKEPRAIPSFNAHLRILRPLLGFKKTVILSYGEQFAIPFVEDETNLDTTRLRNLVRKSLIPFLEEEFGEGVSGRLTDQAASLERELQALEDISQSIIHEKLSFFSFGTRRWLEALKEVLETIPAPIGERVLKGIFLPFSRSPLGRESAGRLREFFLAGQVAIQLPGALEVRRRKGGICVSSMITVANETRTYDFDVEKSSGYVTKTDDDCC